MRATVEALGRARSPDLTAIAQPLKEGLAALEAATSFVVEAAPELAAAGSMPYLRLLGTVCAGWLMTRLALAAERRSAENGGDTAFLSAKRSTARFYAEHFLALAPGYLAAVVGGSTVLNFDPDQL